MNFDEPTRFIHSLNDVEILFLWGGVGGWVAGGIGIKANLSQS